MRNSGTQRYFLRKHECVKIGVHTQTIEVFQMQSFWPRSEKRKGKKGVPIAPENIIGKAATIPTKSAEIAKLNILQQIKCPHTLQKAI